MKNSTFLKGLLSLILAFSASILLAQPPRTSTLSPNTTQNISTGGAVNFTATRNSNGGNWAGGNSSFTYTWSSSPAGVNFSVNNAVTGDNNSATVATFPTAGSYQITCLIQEGGGGGNATSAATTVNVTDPLPPNLWSVSGTGAIRSYTVDPVVGNITFGPTTIVNPLTSTAAIGKAEANPNDPDGCLYYLNRDDASSLNGVVTVYSLRPDGTGHGSRGTIDMNGVSNDDFSYVRLGFDNLGRGWILAGSGNNIYIASFQGNGVNAISGVNTFGNASLTVAAPGVATEFQNGDLAITAGGTLYALANVTDGQTYIYTLNSLNTPTTLTRKWTVQTAGGTFSGSVNGMAWTQSGSVHFSTATGIYFIDQNTANQVSGTVQATLVPNSGGLGLTDLASDKFPSQTILPLTLKNFGGSLHNSITSLNWETENEQNFSHFEIERSSNGSQFTNIGNKPSLGLSGKSSYQYGDNLSSVTGNVFWYRLKMVDLDGKFKYSSVIMVRKDDKAITGITLNPNPVRGDGIATIRFTAAAQSIVSIKILDLSGRVVLQQNNRVYEGNNSLQLNNADRLQPGNYVAQMINGNDITSVKFTVVR